MTLKGYKRRFKPLELLSEEEVEAIHTASIDILRETGVKFESKWALEFLKKNGCFVDEKDKMVRFPEGLTEDCLRKTPSTFRVKAREDRNDLVFSRDTIYFHDMPAMHTIDLDTHTPRPPTKKEYADYVKVLDALPTVHRLSCYPYFGCEDIPPAMIMPELMAIKFRNTSKFHDSPYSNDCEIFHINMAKTVGTEMLGGASLASPLTWFDSAVNSIRRFIDAGFPVSIASGSFFGATAPATIAGAIAKTNAELMSMLVLIQLLNPGQRVFLWDIDCPQNMSTGSPAFGQIGVSIGNTLFNQMWRYYRVPIANAFPGCVNAKIPDFQSGYEKAIGALISALTGCSIIQFHGCIMGELSGHPVQAVLDDDIAGMIGRFIEGELVNDETLAVDLIKKVGPIPGHYLTTEHTRKWWKKEQFIPKSADRTSNYQAWADGGKKTALDLAKERTKKILKEHEPLKLEKDENKEIDKILEDARKFYKKRGML